MTFDGTDDIVAQADIVTDTDTLSLAGAISLPAASGSGLNGGFTCTGLDVLPNGLFVVGNDGRGVEGDASDNLTASVVILDVDLDTLTATISAEITLASIGLATTTSSVQGVAYVSATHQIAFVKSDTDKIYFLNADTYAYEGEWIGGSVTGLNGLAYDAATDCFIVLDIGANAVYRDRATGTALKTIDTEHDSNDDHLWFSADRRTVFVTNGVNGSDGSIREYRACVPASDPIAHYTLNSATAIEGLVIVGNQAVICNDGGYHAGVAPALNRLLVYDLPPLPDVEVWPTATSVQFYGIIQAASAPASNARCIATIGNPFTALQGGAALLQVNGSNTTLRVTANNVSGNFTVPDLSTKVLVFVDIDLAADTASLYINGGLDPVSTASLTVTANNYVDPAPPVIGSDGAARFFEGNIEVIGATVGQSESRAKLEGYAAWDNGGANVSLLIADHDYKDEPPTTGSPVPHRPLAFDTDEWSVRNGWDEVTGGIAVVTITTLPSNRGASITDLQYQIDGGAWTSLGGTTTGDYNITGLVNDLEVEVAVRAVNSVGNADASATKSVTPTLFTGFQTETETLVAEFDTPPAVIRKHAIDDLIVAAKANGWWTLLDSMMLIGADSQCSLVEWIVPSRSATLVGSPTFTADREFLTNGSSSGVELFNPVTMGSNFTQNSAMFAVWNRRAGQCSNSVAGWFDGTDGVTINTRSNSNTAPFRINQASTVSATSVTNGSGLTAIDRSAASGAGCIIQYRNGAQTVAGNQTSAAINSFAFRFGGVTAALWQASQCAGMLAGGHMTAGQHADMYDDILAYMQAIGAA